ncbi:hypothetical protein Q5752_001246 [Cryptotrichosporon argae]
MFGFGSSSLSSSSSLFASSKEPAQPAAPSRDERTQCWAARDAYFACLDHNGVVQPGEGELGDARGVCRRERGAYEGSCSRSWFEYFNKRRMLELRQQKTMEAAARAREAEAANKGR